MPTLTADRPELQILWAIDQFIVPLVKNRVSEDSQHVKFLAAYNLLYLMRVELSLLRFWISRACGLKEEADYDFFEDLQPLLQLLEDFINFKSLGWRGLDTPSYEKARRYPKLRIVIQEVSDNDTVFDLTKVICLPGSKAPARAAYETVAKFNANNQKRIEGDIYFLYNPEDGTIHEPDHPYVASTFFSDRQPVEMKDKFPVLIHFAKLLLEIGLGQLFVPKRVRLDVELIQWAQSDQAKESLTQGYLEAVLECLRATKSRSRGDPMDEETQCRKVIFSLVSHLDKARHSYRSLDPKRTQQANLYIAKISSGVEQDGVNQIVEAIEWARSYNVHIINMSFSIPKTSEVKKIIKEAENTGVIFFVAASNNGVHAGRSFPATLDTVLCIHATDGKGNKVH
ncbi:hypothetical protein CDV31_005195 [Fusarium ambrosium]|uniref:Uncharacterized protein n=1 Tax=Fusarium ambrosium TaxID=131363 RepID=A0A428ULF6_9HYPO|nr:hypothetical protein CDV31_005195 [Fusarium ambrosium]